jgi:hypothetical protein
LVYKGGRHKEEKEGRGVGNAHGSLPRRRGRKMKPPSGGGK